MIKSHARGACPVCGPYVIECEAAESGPGYLTLNIPADFQARHEATEDHIYLQSIRRAHYEATHYRQEATT